jgi:peptidoglycan-associated lipoprotein
MKLRFLILLVSISQIFGCASRDVPAYEESNSKDCITAHSFAPAVYFEINSYEISEKGKELLKKLLYFSKLRNTTTYIDSYADVVGSKSYNLKLSQLRAKSVKEFLVNMGAPPSNIVIRAHGETLLRYKGTDENMYYLNRVAWLSYEGK